MKKACSKCGKIHERNYICSASSSDMRKKAESQAFAFRSKQIWKRKSHEIRDRDLNLCQVCRRNLYNTRKVYNGRDISVHHIVSLVADYDRRLDNSNLITLCRYHHELAELGRIPQRELLAIVAEQEGALETTPLPLAKPKAETSDTYVPLL